jgi:hypothetical protein
MLRLPARWRISAALRPYQRHCLPLAHHIQSLHRLGPAPPPPRFKRHSLCTSTAACSPKRARGGVGLARKQW